MPLLLPFPPFDEGCCWTKSGTWPEVGTWPKDPTTPPSPVPSTSPPFIATLCRVILECDPFVYILYVVGKKSHAKTSF